MLEQILKPLSDCLVDNSGFLLVSGLVLIVNIDLLLNGVQLEGNGMPILNLFFGFHVVRSDRGAVSLSRYSSVVFLIELLMLLGSLLDDHGELTHVFDRQFIAVLHGRALLRVERMSDHFVRIAEVLVRIEVKGKRPEGRHLKSEDHPVEDNE